MKTNAALKIVESRTVIIPLHMVTDIETRHYLLGQALTRIREFAERYDLDARGDVLAREVERDFVSDQPEFFLVVAVRNGRVIGHLLTKAIRYYGNLFVYVHEWGMSEGITREEEQQGFEYVVNWKEKIGAVGIRALVPTPAHCRLLQSKFQFDPFLTVLKRG